MVQLALVASRLMVATTLTVASASWFTKMFRATPLAPTTMHPRGGLKSHPWIRRGTITATLTNAIFAEVTIDSNSYVSTPVDGGATWCIDAITLEGQNPDEVDPSDASDTGDASDASDSSDASDASDPSDASDSSDASDANDSGGSSDDGGCASTTQAPLWLLTALIACRRRQRLLSLISSVEVLASER